MIDEVYGPGFHYRTPPLPLGAYLARIHTRVRIRLPPPERGIVGLFALTKGLRRRRKDLAGIGASASHGSQDDVVSSKMRATLATHGAARGCRLIYAKGPDWWIFNWADSATKSFTVLKTIHFSECCIALNARLETIHREGVKATSDNRASLRHHDLHRGDLT